MEAKQLQFDALCHSQALKQSCVQNGMRGKYITAILPRTLSLQQVPETVPGYDISQFSSGIHAPHASAQ